MPDKTLQFTITAKDTGVKQVFSEVSSAATQLGATVASSSAKSSAAFETLRTHAAALASLMTTTVIRSFEALAAAGEKESQAQRQLQQAVENTGAVYEDYAAALEKASKSAAKVGVSNVDATRALQALTELTGSTSAAMGLLSTAEDLAAAKHMDLVSAATLIGRVYDGNIGILKRYGIIVTEGATSTEALAQIQTKFAGQAEAGTTTLSHWRAEVENITGAMGQALGPFAGLITILPAMNAGVQLSITTGGVFVDMLKAQRAAAEAAAVALEAESAAAVTAGEATAAAAVAGEGAAVAEGGLLAALTGPVGLVIALAAAGAGIAYLIHQHNAESDSLKAVTINVDALRASYAALAHANIGQSNLGTLFGISQQAGSLTDQFAAEVKKIQDMKKALDDQAVATGGFGFNPLDPTGAPKNQSVYEEQRKIAQGEIDALNKLAGSSADAEKAGQNVSYVYAHLADSGVDATRVTNELSKAFSDYQKSVANGAPNFVQLEKDLQSVKGGMYANTQAATDATDAWTKLTTAMTTAWTSVMDPMANAETEIKHIGSSMDATAVSAQKLANDALDQFKTVVDHGSVDQIAAAYKVLGETLTNIDTTLGKSEGLHTFLSSLQDAVTPIANSSADAQAKLTEHALARNVRSKGNRLRRAQGTKRRTRARPTRCHWRGR